MLKHIKSFRQFVDDLDAVDDIQHIDAEVDWNLEIGAIIRRSYDLRAPAPLFTNITGYRSSGFRVLGAPGSLSGSGHRFARLALAVGLPADSTGQQIVQALADARSRPGIPPVQIAAADAPCKQNIMTGEDIDLLAFPTPFLHGNDGGRYIQTYGMNIVRTPDRSWTNWSINRMMIAGKDTLACLIPAPQHLGIIRSQWTAIGEPMPIALAIGVEPGLPLVGGMPLPEGADESHYLGALFGEGIEVVPAETVDLPVPATAEIVIEGHISIDKTVMEGPFNEFPGYNATDASPKQLFTVSAITYRDSAILPAVTAGPPVEEDHTIIGTTSAAEILHLLRQAELPVTSAWYNFEAALHWLSVAVRQDWHETTGLGSHDLVQRIAEVIFAGKPGVNAPKILVVEDDIDITDLDQVVWAFATRSHPDVDRGEFHFPTSPSDQLAVYLSPEEQHTFRAGKVIYNCLLADLFPDGRRPVKGSFENGWPREIQQKVLTSWRDYGYATSNDVMEKVR
ncbi:UbiD-like decarboxylase [Flexivirga endophytica]|uniref:Pyrrole-2-carboxylic acid decarboxylase n=1 Tax=Flexivirga endophytica TaxID=1849103 RepID=A0A916WPZ0_9MICO|nr:UbiD family decarboxylase [Flexivirga endophytica]GGB23457.1 UbiD-like decarboxylase [Flexivirga endophytica]GHB57391.1 UbiD-like decarboxylase [Flexivirga endophytica]